MKSKCKNDHWMQNSILNYCDKLLILMNPGASNSELDSLIPHEIEK